VTDLATTPQGGDESVSTTANVIPAGLEDEAFQQLSLQSENADGDASGDEAEIEHEGKTYRVPAALKAAFLIHADYTRKTQGLAEQRKALAEQDASLKSQAQTHAEHAVGITRLLAYDDTLARYEQLHWHALQAQNPEQAQALWSQYMTLKNQRAAAATDLQARLINWQQATGAVTANRAAECQAILSREIKNWSPELHGKLKEFGTSEFGFTPHEVASVTDPRLIKVLHRAMIGDQMIKKAAAEARAAEQQGVRPLPQVGSSAPATRWSASETASDGASTAEWMRRRNEQLRKQQ
jgi:hypothetical protein